MTLSPPPMPLLSISSPETIEKCSSLPLCDSDVFICSYPKSGTTWTQHMVLSLLFCHLANMNPNTKNNKPPYYNHVSDYSPFLEIDAHWQDNELIPSIRENHDKLKRRVFNTHLRFDMLPKKRTNANAKFIYIIRSPLDVCVSFYHHLSHQVEGGYHGSFDDFFQDWMSGKIAFGSWIHHVLSFAYGISSGVRLDNGSIQLKDGQRQLLLLDYQDMVNDLETTVSRLVNYLELNVTQDQIQRDLLPTFSFASMKSDLDRFQPQSVSWKNNFVFLRKGVPGDSSTHVSARQQEAFVEWMETEQYKQFLSSWLEKSHPQAHQQFMALV